MPARRALALLLPLAACTTFEPEPPEPGDPEAAASVDRRGAEPHPDTLDDTGPCATPPLGGLESIGDTETRGTGNYREVMARISWRVHATDRCVDRYLPAAGSIRYIAYGSECGGVAEPPSGPVDPSDGTLMLDRSTSPPTYVMRGTGYYEGTFRCHDEPPPGDPRPLGGTYSEHAGSFDGDLHGGGGADTYITRNWRLWRSGTDFTPPAPGTCVEPPHDVWMTVTSYENIEADITWTRVSTTGCVDTFTPAGTARWLPKGSCTVDPPTGPVAAADGTLQIDRSTNPPTFRIDGHSRWPAVVTCHWGTTTYGGGTWARVAAPYDGNQFSGEYQTEERSSWYVAKL